jgi:hypothetical protein
MRIKKKQLQEIFVLQFSLAVEVFCYYSAMDDERSKKLEQCIQQTVANPFTVNPHVG